MSATADVSVIIPSNRHSPYLEEAVGSVRRQTVPVREIILVDDGSPAPGLASVAEALGLVYVRQDASGVSAARNRGAAIAQARWIAFLDDDDVWYPTKVEDQLEALAGAPDAIACHSDLTIMDERGDVIEQAVAGGTSRTELLRRPNGVSINTLLLERQTYLTIGGCDTALTHAEDLDLVIRMLQVGHFAKVHTSLVGYRRHSGQATADGARSVTGYLSVIRRAVVRAQHAGDRQTAALLSAHLRDVLPGMAEWEADDLLTHLARGRFQAAMTSASRLARDARAAAMPAVARCVTRRLSRVVSRRRALQGTPTTGQ